MKRETIFSPCRKYRYTLWREWGIGALPLMAHQEKPDAYAMFIGLNPSTADETKDDPTIRRCIGFAKAWGYGALCMTNLFAFRATDPKDMMKRENLVDIDQQHHLLKCASEAGIVVAAWGVHGTYAARDLTVRGWLSQIGVKLHHLGLTKDGHPKHPLYLPNTVKPMPFIE